MRERERFAHAHTASLQGTHARVQGTHPQMAPLQGRLIHVADSHMHTHTHAHVAPVQGWQQQGSIGTILKVLSLVTSC